MRKTGAKMMMDGRMNGDRVDEVRVGQVQIVGHGVVLNRALRGLCFMVAKKFQVCKNSFRCGCFCVYICLIGCTSVLVVVVPW